MSRAHRSLAEEVYFASLSLLLQGGRRRRRVPLPELGDERLCQERQPGLPSSGGGEDEAQSAGALRDSDEASERLRHRAPPHQLRGEPGDRLGALHDAGHPESEGGDDLRPPRACRGADNRVLVLGVGCCPPSPIRVAERKESAVVAYEVDFTNVSTVGLESSPVAAALAGLRAHEARYFKNKYDQPFVVEPATRAKKLIEYVHRVLKQERDIAIGSRPLEATELNVENIRWTYVFYESGLAINVLYSLDDRKKRAVGFKLSDGMEVPPELASRFKFAKQKSKLAGTIRGSFFVIKGDY